MKTNDNSPVAEPMLTTGEVAALYKVDQKTVARWIKDGRLTGVHIIRTPGGHHRISETGIRELLNGTQS